MYRIDYIVLSLIVTYAAVLFFVSAKIIKEHNRRLLILLVIFSTTIYSGIGISITEVGVKHLYNFFIFITVFIVTIIIVFKNTGVKTIQENNFDVFCKKHKIIFFILSLIFIGAYFINLIIPVNRINELWNPPLITINNIFERREEYKNIFALEIASLLKNFLQAFFFIYLYTLKLKGKTFNIIILILVWIYLDYLQISYMGRSKMILFTLFIFLILTLDKENNFTIRKKHIIIVALIGLVAVPFLFWIQYYRTGIDIGQISFSEAFSLLFSAEIYYPIHYEIIDSNMKGMISPQDYFMWLIFLPVPSIFFPVKPSLEINTIFSEFLLGFEKGAEGYYVLLPSVLGESYLIYGMNFFWIHAIVTGLIISIIWVLLEKSKSLIYLSLFYTVSILLMARGGSQGYLAQLINCTFPIIVIILVTKVINKKKHKRLYEKTNP